MLVKPKVKLHIFFQFGLYPSFGLQLLVGVMFI